MAPGQLYKIKLSTGRILGPLDLERARLLVRKNHIIGSELAREYPDGDWKEIGQIPPLADLVIAKAEGRLGGINEPSDKTAVADPIFEALPGSTMVIPEQQSISFGTLPEISADEAAADRTVALPDGGPGHDSVASTSLVSDEDDEKTRVEEVEEATVIQQLPQESASRSVVIESEQPRNRISEAATVVFQRSTPAPVPSGRVREGRKEKFKAILLALMLGLLGYELLLEEKPKSAIQVAMAPVRPALPSTVEGKINPEQSGKIYAEGMRHYVLDNVAGYKVAAEKFRASASLDPGNVKALAMLASSYLNLIDSSNKDENYFSVLSRLIEMSRAKNLDLPETVIADVEFYITANKAEAAQNRIVEYTKTHQNFDIVMFYYLALAFQYRGDPQAAARYLSQFPDNKAFSPKIFHLRGQIAERLGDAEAAIREYSKAISFNRYHAKSRLRVAAILNEKGQVKEAIPHLEFLVSNPQLLAPKDLGLAYFLHSRVSQLNQKWDIALGAIERAVRLDKDNHDYLLELFTLRAKAGDKVATFRADARMFYFLSEGEKVLREGKYQDALTQFLQARQYNDKSHLPPIKIGDMFARAHDVSNARLNYRLAAERAPNNIEVWSKYINILIQSYEWDEAQKAMDKFRKLNVPQSAIDKAAADMYAKQGRHNDAQAFYRKAMGRDVIDPAVYIAYANSLVATKNFKEAPFFFALALRFDPLNTDAIIGTAKCIASTESIDRAISMLQDELQKGSGARAELLTGIAELQMQKGDWAQAQANIDQAIAASQEYALPWKLQAQIHMNKENVERGALDRALHAFQSYSERNPSDPSGYLERYRIFVKKTEFEKAGEELQKIYGIYPKYPRLHYFKGLLYATMGNHKASIDEFRTELANNPRSVEALLALGREFVELGAASEGLVQFNKAMQLAPKTAEPKAEAAWANYLLKNYAGAIALFQAALAYDKANPTLYKRLGLAYRDAGDTASAAQAFRKYLEMEPDAPDKAEFERYL